MATFYRLVSFESQGNSTSQWYSLPSIPVGHSVHNKESYENMKILMEAINYDKFKWQIYGDLKVIALLLVLKRGFTKYCCFICEWDSRARTLH